MPEFIQIHWTCENIDEARKICRVLVREKYVACANIIPCVESIFIWEDKLNTTQETKVLLKTDLSNYDVIKNFITENCSYDVPEIIFTKIDGGNEDYMKWLEQNVIPVIVT